MGTIDKTSPVDPTSAMHEDDDEAPTNCRSTHADLFLASEAMDTRNTNDDASTQPSGKVLFINGYVFHISQDFTDAEIYTPKACS